MAESRATVERYKLPFALLADPDLALIKALGMLHPGAGPGGRDIARPGTFIVGRDGRIAWMHVSSNLRDRPDPAELAEVLRRMAR